MATRILFANNASTTLAQGVSSTATVINVASGDGDLFPSPSTDEMFPVTFVDAATGLVNEITYCTSRSGDALTVTRGQEGTTARAWLAGDTFANLITAGTIEEWLQEDDLDGYATQDWVDENALILDKTSEQTVDGAVAFDVSPTVPNATAAQNPVALGQLEALQYVASHPAAGSTNVRITDIQEDASGNLIATAPDGTTQQYAPVTQGVFDAATINANTNFLGGSWRKTGNVLEQWLTYQTTTTGTTNGTQVYAYPLALAAAPLAVMITAGTHMVGAADSVIANIDYGRVNPAPTATQFATYIAWATDGSHGLTVECTFTVYVKGTV